MTRSGGQTCEINALIAYPFHYKSFIGKKRLECTRKSDRRHIWIAAPDVVYCILGKPLIDTEATIFLCSATTFYDRRFAGIHNFDHYEADL